MRAVFVRFGGALEFAGLQGSGNSVLIDGPKEEGIVVGATEQMQGAVFGFSTVFEDGEEKFRLGLGTSLTEGEGEEFGLLGFVLG